MGVVSTIVAVGVAVTAAAAAHQEKKKSASKKGRANKAQREINKLKNKQAKRNFLRQFRQAQANVLVESVAAGVGLESSAFQATLSSQKQQAITAVQEVEAQERLGERVAKLRRKAGKHDAAATTFSGVSQIASQFISFGGG